MKRLKDRTFKDFSYPEDVRRIVIVAATAGYFFSPGEAEDLWSSYSGELCASWLGLPKTDERLKKKLCQLIEEEDVPDLYDDE